MKRLFLLFIVLFFSISGFVFAEAGTIDLSKYTKITLSETAEKELPQDRILAKLSFKERDRSSEKAQKSLNKKITEAIDYLKKDSSLLFSTGSYRVYQRYNKKEEWEASQQILIDSDNEAPLMSAVDHLQTMGLTVDHLQYYLSDAKRDRHVSALTTQALKSLKQRASLIATDLGKKDIHFSEIRVPSNTHYRPQPLYEATYLRKTSQDSPPPSVEPASERVQVTVEADVLIL